MDGQLETIFLNIYNLWIYFCRTLCIGEPNRQVTRGNIIQLIAHVLAYSPQFSEKKEVYRDDTNKASGKVYLKSIAISVHLVLKGN